jgi:molecular chaperone GrpE
MNDNAFNQHPGGAAADSEAEPSEVPELPPASDEPIAAREAEALRQELAECQDRFLRKAAEFDNYRRRTERERREQADRAVSDLLLDFVGIVDDLERALTSHAAGEGAKAYRSGIEIIRRKMLDVLKRRDVRPIVAVGAAFDPAVHQAVTTEVVEGRPDGEVIEELRRGYMIGDRLLRPAMVKVSRT